MPCKSGHPTRKHPNSHYLAFALTQVAAEQSGDRQRREKALPFLKEEKSEHERARQYEIAIQLVCARHCELPLSKMGSKGLFPGRVSEANQGRGQPRRGYRRPKPATHSGAGRKSRRAACFLWYFLSLRKKVLPPSGRQPHRSRRSRRVIPPAGVSLRQGCLTQQLSPPAPFGPSRLKALPSGQR